jgi:hypothetical protein
MEPEDFKQAWQASAGQRRLTIDTDVLLQEVRRKQQQFDTMILFRDMREVGVGIVLIPIWIGLGWKVALPWTWWLMLPGLIWIVGFMLIDRRLHRRRPNAPGEPLRQHVERALSQVEHQIWLLRNVWWWYLLPIALPMFAFFGQGSWENRADGWLAWLVLAVASVVVGGVFVFIYWLNQVAVRSSLNPRRQELETLLASLQAEPAQSSD